MLDGAEFDKILDENGFVVKDGVNLQTIGFPFFFGRNLTQNQKFNEKFEEIFE